MNHLFPGRVVEESRKEIEALLSGFGLSGNEVKALITIVKLGRVKASVLARETGIPRPEIYRILRKLEGRGIIRVRLSHPKEFFAIEPEKIVNRLLGSIQDKVIKLVAKRERLISSLGSLSIRVVEPDESLEVISGGLQAVYRKMSEMGRHAGRRVDYLTSSTGMHIADYSGLLDVLRERSKDINVRIITEFDAEALFNTEVSLSNLISIRYLQRTPFSIFIVDREEAIVGVTPKMERWKSSDDSCKDIWTNDFYIWFPDTL